MLDRHWTTKPPTGWPIDWGSPLAQGLVSAWLLSEGAGPPYDWAARQFAASSSATWSPNPMGQGLKFNGTSQSVATPTAAAYAITGPLTIAFAGNPTNTGANQIALDTRTAGNAAGYAILVNPSGGFNLSMANSGLSGGASSNSAADGNWHVFSAGLAGTGTGQAAFYRDGAPWGTATIASFPAAATSGRIGSNTAGTSTWYSGSMGLVLVWSRALAASEHAALAANPWQLFRMPGRRLPSKPTYVGTAAGGAVIGGKAAPAPTWAPKGAGGVVLGGKAPPAPTWKPRGAGGAVIGGKAPPAPTWKPRGAGGVVLGGKASGSTGNTFTATAAGGAVLGGHAIPSTRYTVSAAGGAVLGGHAIPSTTFAAHAAGGAVLGGKAIPSTTFAAHAAGGAVLGGRATGSTGTTFTATAAGGVVLGGSTGPSITILAGGPCPDPVQATWTRTAITPDPAQATWIFYAG